MVDVNASITDPRRSWEDRSAINAKRQAIADTLVQQCIDNGLTVATAHDVLDRAKTRLERLVNDFPVAGLCTHPSCPTDSQKP